jgi:predicted AlkP superfamily phosphohydrolase/phosphomutase
MTEDRLFDLLIAILPSLIVFGTAFFSIRQFLAGDQARRQTDRLVDQKREDRRHTLPLRLQAYERLTLFLERIAPGALVFRVHKSSMSSRMLHQALLDTIREEFEHNVTQQVYVSDKAWQQVRQAKEETIRIINIAFEQTGEERSGTQLSQQIFEMASRLSHLPNQVAILFLKEEVRKLF